MNPTPCNPNATEEVKTLLRRLSEIEGKGLLTGQHTQSKPQEELQTIERVTGELPAICGFELLSYSPNIRWGELDEECQSEVDTAKDTLEEAFAWAKRGGIVTLTWHWFSPLYGHDKSFYTENTEYDARLAIKEGTPEYEAMCNDLDVMAGILDQFQQAHIPILWRPFHESEGKWFWWGAKGYRVACKLYQFMWHYFTEKHQLNHLIWVWNNPIKAAYVGDTYCDIVSRDLYPEAHNHTDLAAEYQELRALSSDKGAAVAELGVIPDVDAVKKNHIPWLWYMTWSHEFCNSEKFNSFEELRKMYGSDYAITLKKWVKIV